MPGRSPKTKSEAQQKIDTDLDIRAWTLLLELKDKVAQIEKHLGLKLTKTPKVPGLDY